MAASTNTPGGNEMTTKAIVLKGSATLMAATAMILSFAANAGSHHGDHQHKKDMHKGHNAPTFAEVDANADGYIVAEELYQMHGKRMAARVAEGRKLKNAGKGPNFEQIDLDGDGKLTPEEFAAHQAQCRHAKRSD